MPVVMPDSREVAGFSRPRIFLRLSAICLAEECSAICSEVVADEAVAPDAARTFAPTYD